MIQYYLKTLSYISLLTLGFWTSAYALDNDNGQPLMVTSDTMTIQSHEGIATYAGQVTATQGSRTLKADKVTLYRNPHTQKLDKVIATGGPATYQFISEPNQPPILASANMMLYLPKEQLLILTDHASVTQGGNIFKGPKITYNIAKATINAPSSDDSRPTMTILPYKKLEETHLLHSGTS